MIKRYMPALGVTLAAGSLLMLALFGLKSPPAEAADGLQVRLVFGPEQDDVTDQVDWFASRTGLVAAERRSSVTNALTGYDFAERIRGEENYLGPVSGDLGLELQIGPVMLFFRADVTADMTELTLPLDDYARIVLVSDSMTADDIVSVSFANETTVIEVQSAWLQAQGPYYLPPATYRIDVRRADSGTGERHDLAVAAGDDVVITLGMN